VPALTADESAVQSFASLEQIVMRWLLSSLRRSHFWRANPSDCN